jgi:hypothetical protein
VTCWQQILIPPYGGFRIPIVEGGIGGLSVVACRSLISRMLTKRSKALAGGWEKRSEKVIRSISTTAKRQNVSRQH